MFEHIRGAFSRLVLLVLVSIIAQSSASSISNPKTPPVSVKGNGMWLLKRK
jgi:hypothetical protein